MTPSERPLDSPFGGFRELNSGIKDGAGFMEDRVGIDARAAAATRGLSPWVVGCLILGVYLSVKGYHSLDGDQAYRLPPLLRQLDPTLYADDPFVRSFDAFNPHRGAFLVIGGLTRVVGLSAALAILFVLTFAATIRGAGRLANAVWPEFAGRAGLAAIGLFLIAKAGNIGTNHLFASMLLDRLMALAFGWLAAAAVVENPRGGWRFSAFALGLAAVVHPSIGLQLALIFAGSWVAWAFWSGRTAASWRLAVLAGAAGCLAVVPGLILNLWPFSSIREGLPPEKFRLLTVELQSPQHMLPLLWRMSQWLAAGAYLALAVVALWDSKRRDDADAGPSRNEARSRLVLMLAVALVWLAGSWVAVEGFRHIGATVFQPFRMATLARGLALILAGGYVVSLWGRGGWLNRLRAALIPLGLTGDWLFVVVVVAELGAVLIERVGERFRLDAHPAFPMIHQIAHLGVLGYGCLYLSRHDTERGDQPLLAVVVVWLVASAILARRRSVRSWSWTWTPRRLRLAMAAAWAVPLGGLIAGMIPADRAMSRNAIVRGLVERCRFAASPVNDMEALALWCRENTPEPARFIGPPGPKEFRLWSRRSLAFNRAGSPYNAKALNDWYERFADHVDFQGTPTEFVRAYLAGRHQLEARYDAMTDAARAALARRQGADYVIARSPEADGGAVDASSSPLELLHVEGAYAVYRVRPEAVAQRH